MADEDDVKKQEQEAPPDSKAESGDQKILGGRLLWIITAVVVIVGAGAGFGLGRLLGASGKTETAQSAEGGQARPENLKADTTDSTGAKSQGTWYYDQFEPVVANLDEPSVTRYVRLTLIMEIDAQVDKKKGTAFIGEKKHLLTNWLTIYLAGLSLEDIRGEKNLKRIQSEIVDAFNEKLFPDAKPQIKRVLFKEFAIQ
ncbi:MAG: flagellar basal body-associated FliL family protein [Phycisphaerae bacterium]|nr:flagellar basal body-associated FliL family protein [Phycisphaerae bacterium]